MRRADRLFQIIQILRRSKRPRTAKQISEELEVSKRTVYRDITDLIAQRVPIEGEPGIGYVLLDYYDLPPLMFSPEELEAVILGMSFVKTLPNDYMALAADDVLAKIKLVVPDRLLKMIQAEYVRLKPEFGDKSKFDTRLISSAVRDHRKMSITYRDKNDDCSKRVIWPIFLGYDNEHCLLAAWCELREQFRNFRVDRIVAHELLPNGIPRSLVELRNEWDNQRIQSVKHYDENASES